MDLSSIVRAARLVGEAGFALCVAGLAAVDVISWRRTRPLRTGLPPPGPPGSSSEASSPTTALAAAAGASALIFGLAGGRSGVFRWAFVLAGAFVAVTGLVARVTGLRTDDSGLTVQFAWRTPVFVPWEECVELRPPRTPLGGWRLVGRGSVRSLMPSDVLGNEWFLASVVAHARLEFAGACWRKEWDRPVSRSA